VKRFAFALVTLALGCLSSACVVGRQLVADNGELASYRAFRVAAHEGARLRGAQRYLEAYPNGQWASEVRAAFEEEEPAYFEQAKSSRDSVRDYLVDLPRGPHADAALSLLVALDARVEDVETARLLRDARRTEASLESAASKRRRIGETIADTMAALLDPSLYGAPLADAPPLLRRALSGGTDATWGGALSTRRESDLFFTIPSREGRQSRVATMTIAVETASGVVVEGRIQGVDLFVRWDEADNLRELDASSTNHRAEAAFHAQEFLEGAVEARLPGERCTVPRAEGELLHRACDGWSAVVRWGRTEGEPDVVTIRGPKP
jgi:hypothetical protein